MSKILQAMKMISPGDRGLETRLKTAGTIDLHSAPVGSQVQEFENLANSIIHLAANESEGVVVVFSSTNRGEGTSYVSFNCARYLALMVGDNVAWIDGNFRNPHKKLKNHSLTLSSLLDSPDDIPRHIADRGGVTLVGNGENTSRNLKRLSGPRYAQLMQTMKENFSFTIIDTPPILDSVELGHLAKNTLGMVLVVQSQRLKHEVVKHGLERVASQNVNLLGMVLNKRQFQLPKFVYNRV